MVKCFRKILMNCFSFENWKSTDMGGGVNYLVYHAPSSLEFKFPNLGTVRGACIFCYITPPASLESQL